MNKVAEGGWGENPAGLAVGGIGPILRSLLHTDTHNQEIKTASVASLADKRHRGLGRGAEGVGQLTGTASAPGPSLRQADADTYQTHTARDPQHP